MTDFTLTPEQEAIITAAKTTSDNLLISALAGAAKTSTLVLIAKALQTVPTLCLAFNKRIATEMERRLPGNCQSMTLNSLGHRAWAQALGTRLRLERGKNYTIIKTLIEALSDQEVKDELWENYGSIITAVKLGKAAGYVPDGHFPSAKPLIGDEAFFKSLIEEPTAAEETLIRKATIISLEQGLKGTVDFDDQLLLPTIFTAPLPRFPLVLIDEAQDLSELNHAMLLKMVKKRLIAVGDECQAIYAFRGAHEHSMKLLKKTFDMTTFMLSVSFRCPQTIVKEAQWRAPHMQWPEWATAGAVNHPECWEIEDLNDDTVIICRNNAPIFKIALTLLKNGRYPEVVGNDIGKALIKIMKRFGKLDLLQEKVMTHIGNWEEAKVAKSRKPQYVEDQADCMRIFAREGKDLGDAIAYAEALFNAEGPIQLMTGHKSKGLEFKHVFFLDQHLIRKGAQEDNLRYVIQTRAMESLTYITSETLLV